jgi:hypothetical protein
MDSLVPPSADPPSTRLSALRRLSAPQAVDDALLIRARMPDPLATYRGLSGGCLSGVV